MRLGAVREVMMSVEDPAAAARCWGNALGLEPHTEHALLDLGHVELFFHPADAAKNPRGGSTVVYSRSTTSKVRVTRFWLQAATPTAARSRSTTAALSASCATRSAPSGA